MWWRRRRREEGAPRRELGAPAGRTVPAAHGLRSGGRSGAKPGRAAAGGGGSRSGSLPFRIESLVETESLLN